MSRFQQLERQVSALDRLKDVSARTRSSEEGLRCHKKRTRNPIWWQSMSRQASSALVLDLSTLRWQSSALA